MRDISRPGINSSFSVANNRPAVSSALAIGETGSHRDPNWSETINALGTELDSALAKTIAGRTLSDLLDEFDEKKD